MWNRALAAILTVGMVGMISSVGWSANEASGAAVVKYMPTAKLSLQDALTAAEAQGQPISGKFDQNTGKVAKSEAITEGNDLADAQRQMEAYSKSKTSLKTAVSQAEMANPGYRAVSVTPRLSNGRPVAVVSLVQGTQVRSIAEPLT
jgi:hypothetical protein